VLAPLCVVLTDMITAATNYYVHPAYAYALCVKEELDVRDGVVVAADGVRVVFPQIYTGTLAH